MSVEEFVPFNEEKLQTAEGVQDLNRIMQSHNNILRTVPIFHVNKNNVNQSGIATATFTKLTWSTEVIDTNDNFSSNKFTPTIYGYYLLVFSVRIGPALADGSVALCSLYKNGSELARGNQFIVYNGAGTGSVGTNGAFIVYANGKTDYFELYVWHNTGSDESVAGDNINTFFQGFRILE